MFLTCPVGKWCFLRNSNDRGNVKSILLVNSFFGLVEMMAGLVNASFSLPEGQAVKMIFSAPCSLCWEFAFIPKSGMKSLFIRIDSSSHTADSSAKVITSFMSLFLPVYLFCCHGYFFFSNRLLGTFFHRFCFRFRFCFGFHFLFHFRFRFRIPDSMF